MAIPINKLVGVTPELEAKLKEEGIYRSDQLLDAALTPDGRKELAKRIGVKPRVILELADRADLVRISGVGGVLSDLVEHIGVKTVTQLAKQRPAHLHHELEELIEEKKIKLVGRPTSLDMVKRWITQAKAMDKML